MADHSTAASRSSWRVNPLPAERAPLQLAGVYDLADFERIKAGLVPEEMEDKWFMFFEAPWLYVHHSWTFFCIYGARFQVSSQGAAIAESWANRNEEQWGVTDDEFDARWLKFLIDSLLLKRRVPFPGAASPLAQHILAGRVFPDGSE